MREQASVSAPQRVAIEVSLDDLVERAALEEIHHGRGECWDALRQAGALDNHRVALLMQDLTAAHAAIDSIEQEMEALSVSPEIDSRAAALLLRFVHAHRDRASALARFASCPVGSKAP